MEPYELLAFAVKETLVEGTKSLIKYGINKFKEKLDKHGKKETR